jgi:multidrug transporter EmrE-like cation transporter
MRNLTERRTSPFVAAGMTVVLTVYGQGVVKWRVNRAGDAADGVPQQLIWALELLKDPWIWTVVIAVIVASIAWLAAISRLELSIAYPLMSTSLILVVLLGVLAFDEPLTVAKMGGALLVLVGLCVANWPSAAPAQADLGGEQGA